LKIEVRKHENKEYKVVEDSQQYNLYYEKGAKTFNSNTRSGTGKMSRKSNWVVSKSKELSSTNKKKGLKVMASEVKVRNAWEEKLNGSVDTEECLTILRSVIKKEDVFKVEETISLHSDPETGTISYKKFEKIVLDFFLSQHENFLSKTRQIFKSLDVNDDGILQQHELVNSIGYIDPMNELKFAKEEFVQLCDPFNTDSVTFSKFIKV